MSIIHDSFFFSELQSVLDEKKNYIFANATYPWEVYNGPFANLGVDSFRYSRALILENLHLDKDFFDTFLGSKQNNAKQPFLNLLISHTHMYLSIKAMPCILQ